MGRGRIEYETVFGNHLVSENVLGIAGVLDAEGYGHFFLPEFEHMNVVEYILLLWWIVVGADTEPMGCCTVQRRPPGQAHMSSCPRAGCLSRAGTA